MTTSKSLPAVAQAERAIHDNDVERLKDPVAEYPALLSWRADDEDGGLLNMAMSAYGDAGNAPKRNGSPAEHAQSS